SVPLPGDPYEAIRHAYLDGTDTESEPFEDPINTETPESPLAITPPIPRSESTSPVLVPILCMIACMAVRVPHAISPSLSAGMAQVAAMSESVFPKRFWSSYESSPSVFPLDLPLRKHYCGTSQLVEDSEEDDDEEDEEIKESMDSDSASKDAEDEGPTAEDEDPAAEDEGLTTGVEVPNMYDEGYGLDDESHGIDDEGHSVESDGLGLEEEEEEAVLGGQQQATLVVGTTMSGSGSALESERPERVSALRQPTLTTWTDPEDSMIYVDIPDYPPPAPPIQIPPSPDSDVGGLISDYAVRSEELLLALFKRSLEYEQERVAVTFRAIWRPVIALEAWEGQTDAQRAVLWHAISDVQGENQDLWLQLAEERRARLELAEVVDGIRRGQEPRGGA
ncbi:hypothetical protein Tco_1486742, partial [Tanacetum coccineum]